MLWVQINEAVAASKRVGRNPSSRFALANSGRNHPEPQRGTQKPEAPANQASVAGHGPHVAAGASSIYFRGTGFRAVGVEKEPNTSYLISHGLDTYLTL